MLRLELQAHKINNNFFLEGHYFEMYSSYMYVTKQAVVNGHCPAINVSQAFHE